MGRQYKGILTGTVGPRGNYGPGLILTLNPPVRKKKFAVLNGSTHGYRKAHSWMAEDRFDIEVFYQVGPDALLVTEI